jgi:hypothetical protein
VPAFALESDCGNPLSKPLLAAGVPVLALFAVEAPLDPLWAVGLALEVVDAFFAEDLLDPVLPELVCAKATVPISRAVPTTETIIFITQSPSPKIQSGGKLDASRTRREVSPELPFPKPLYHHGPVGGACPLKSNMSNMSPEAAFREFRLGSAQFHCTSFNIETWSITVWET